jgi:hypothetical protein
MKEIKKSLDLEGLGFGAEVNFGIYRAYLSNVGTEDGRKNSRRVHWTLRREGDTIMEEQYMFGIRGQELVIATIHDKGLSGDYERLDSWLQGVEGGAA